MQRAEILRVCRLLPLPLPLPPPLLLLLLLFWHFHADIIHSVVQAASVCSRSRSRSRGRLRCCAKSHVVAGRGELYIFIRPV